MFECFHDYVHIYDGTDSYMCVCAHSYLHYHSLPFFFLKAELTDCLGLAGQWTPGICLSPSAQHWGHSYGVTGFYISTANPNSGPCIWATVTLPTNLPSLIDSFTTASQPQLPGVTSANITLLCGDLWDHALNHKKKQENERLASLRNSNYAKTCPWWIRAKLIKLSFLYLSDLPLKSPLYSQIHPLKTKVEPSRSWHQIQLLLLRGQGSVDAEDHDEDQPQIGHLK